MTFVIVFFFGQHSYNLMYSGIENSLREGD